MSYSATLNDTGRLLIAHGSNEAAILYDAIYHASRHGEDVHVEMNGKTIWYVEADTKVDDDDPTFPVIVHDRGDVTPA